MHLNKLLLAGVAGLVFAASGSVFAQDTTAPTTTTVQARNRSMVRQPLHDQNGDGICDLTGQPVRSGRQAGQGARAGKGLRLGPGDGTGNQGNGPRDGTGFGRKAGRGDPANCTGNGARRGGGGGRRGRQ